MHTSGYRICSYPRYRRKTTHHGGEFKCEGYFMQSACALPSVFDLIPQTDATKASRNSEQEGSSSFEGILTKAIGMSSSNARETDSIRADEPTSSRETRETREQTREEDSRVEKQPDSEDSAEKTDESDSRSEHAENDESDSEETSEQDDAPDETPEETAEDGNGSGGNEDEEGEEQTPEDDNQTPEITEGDLTADGSMQIVVPSEETLPAETAPVETDEDSAAVTESPQQPQYRACSGAANRDNGSRGTDHNRSDESRRD